MTVGFDFRMYLEQERQQQAAVVQAVLSVGVPVQDNLQPDPVFDRWLARHQWLPKILMAWRDGSLLCLVASDIDGAFWTESVPERWEQHLIKHFQLDWIG